MSKYKDKIGRYRTKSLFCEFPVEGYSPVFTLESEDKEWEGNTMRSMRAMYVSYDDDWSFAKDAFGGWEQWEAVKESAVVAPVVEGWERERFERMKQEAIAEAVKQSKDGNFAASKWIATKGWETKRGRPSKEEVEGERKKQAKANGTMDEHYDRMLRLVKG
jgi:carbohydrate-selective porin OprB